MAGPLSERWLEGLRWLAVTSMLDLPRGRRPTGRASAGGPRPRILYSLWSEFALGLNLSAIQRQLPKELVPWVASQNWLKVRAGAKAGGLLAGGVLTPLWIHRLPRGLSQRLRNELASLVPQIPNGALPQIVGSSLSVEHPAMLENAHFSYLDGRGHLHLHALPIVLHLEGRVARAQPAESGLGAAGIKTVQLILTESGPSR